MKLGIDVVYIVEKHSGNICHNMKYKYSDELEGKKMLVFEEALKKFQWVNKNTGEIAQVGQRILKEEQSEWVYEEYFTYRERIVNVSAIADIAVQDNSDEFRITGMEALGNFF